MRSGIHLTLAHELCHLLVDRDAGAELPPYPGRAPKSIEQRANAFAAALLMPDAMIIAEYASLGSHPSDGCFDNLIKVSKALDVSPDALSRHLLNRNYIDASQCESLRSQFGRRA